MLMAHANKQHMLQLRSFHGYCYIPARTQVHLCFKRSKLTHPILEVVQNLLRVLLGLLAGVGVRESSLRRGTASANLHHQDSP